MRGWRIRSVVIEASSNVAAAAMRTLLITAGFGMAFGSIVWIELDFTTDLLGYVGVVTSEELPIPAASCEALNGLTGVVAAGGIRQSGLTSVESAPGTLFQRAYITVGIIRVWDPSARRVPSNGAHGLGSAAARYLGVRSGSPITPSGETTRPAYVIGLERRNEQASGWFFNIVPPHGVVDQCWVELAPTAYAGWIAAIPAQFPHHQVAVRRVAALDQFSRDPATELERRSHRFAWLAVGAILAAITSIASWFRRSEMGVYRAFGMPRVGLLLMHQVETMMIGVASLAMAVVWAVALFASNYGFPETDQIQIAASAAAKALLLLIIAAPIGATLAARGDPAMLLKEQP
jgi:uncharacterized protein YhhL (DUF1145 family)